MWSTRSMPITTPAATSRCVSSWSSGLGVGSPDGWLWIIKTVVEIAHFVEQIHSPPMELTRWGCTGGCNLGSNCVERPATIRIAHPAKPPPTLRQPRLQLEDVGRTTQAEYR